MSKWAKVLVILAMGLFSGCGGGGGQSANDPQPPATTNPPAPTTPEDGDCGAANMQRFASPPTSGLCAAGNPTTPVSDTTGGNWICLGKNGGRDAIGRWLKMDAPSEHGVCGIANGTATINQPPKALLCAPGIPTAISFSSYTSAYQWSCGGSDGGNSVECSAPKMISGTCGPAAGGSFTDRPDLGSLCTQGTATGVFAHLDAYTWSCLGKNNGTAASCSAARKPTGFFASDFTIRQGETKDMIIHLSADGMVAAWVFDLGFALDPALLQIIDIELPPDANFMFGANPDFSPGIARAVGLYFPDNVDGKDLAIAKVTLKAVGSAGSAGELKLFNGEVHFGSNIYDEYNPPDSAIRFVIQ